VPPSSSLMPPKGVSCIGTATRREPLITLGNTSSKAFKLTRRWSRYQCRETVGAAAEVHRLGCHHRPHFGRNSDHVAARTARSTAVKVAASIPGRTRTMAMPIAISIVGGRSARAAGATAPCAHGGAASMITGAKAEPCVLASSVARSRCAAPPKQLLGGHRVPTCNRRNRLAALIALRDDLRLLLCSPSPPPTNASKQLQPTHGIRFRFGQKLSVRHVSNPLDSVRSDNRRSMRGAEGGA
jgi:hypothetical protein